MRTVHIHPKDTSRVICSVDAPSPPSSWFWCGDDWPSKVPASQTVAKRFVGCVIETSDVERTAKQYELLLGVPFSRKDSCFALGNDQRLVLVESHQPRGDGVVGFLLEATDRRDVGRRHIFSQSLFFDFV